MTFRLKKILLAVYLVILFAGIILTIVFESNDPLGLIFLIAFFVIFLIGVGITLTALRIGNKKISKQMQSFMEQKDYTAAKEFFEKEYKNYLIMALRLHARYCALVSCVASDDIDGARVLIKKRWGASLYCHTNYMEVLINLKDGDLDLARSNSASLLRCKRKNLTHLVSMLNRIFKAIETKDFSDHFYNDSIYPITKEIYDKYVAI